jgi:hypothetical protein
MYHLHTVFGASIVETFTIFDREKLPKIDTDKVSSKANTVTKRRHLSGRLRMVASKTIMITWQRRGGRAVEGTGLENRRGRKVTVGSNPTPSANDQTGAVRHGTKCQPNQALFLVQPT